MPAVCCDCKVLDQHLVNDEISLLRVEWPSADHAPHAGQFMMLRCWDAYTAPFLSRPISVHCWDEATGTVEFLYQIKGAGTQKLAALKAGDTLQVVGSLGNGFDVADLAARYQKIALVGGGIGAAPLYQLARELNAAGVTCDAFFGFRDEPYCMEEFRAVTRQVYVATDTGRHGFHGFVTQIVHPEQYDCVLVCGPEVMMRAVAGLCRQSGTPCLVSMERKMACGIGACLGCTCHTPKGEALGVCKSGPVFDAEVIF